MQNEKDHIKNLESREAIAKLKELIEDAHVCLFGTNVISGPPTQRPMSPIYTDDFGVLWFFSNINSDKNKEIQKSARVQLSFINTSKNEFLCINGNAEIVIDQQKFKALWKPIAQAWFKGGDTDPELSLIESNPARLVLLGYKTRQNDSHDKNPCFHDKWKSDGRWCRG